MQDIIDESLKIRRCILEFKEHDKEFVKSSSSSKDCFSLFFIRDSQEIVRFSHIQDSVVRSLGELVESLFDERKGVTVFNSPFIQATIVDAETKSAILLFDKKDRSIDERRRCTDEPLEEIVLYSCSESFKLDFGHAVQWSKG